MHSRLMIRIHSMSLINSLIRLAGSEQHLQSLAKGTERAKLRSAVVVRLVEQRCLLKIRMAHDPTRPQRLMSVHQGTDLAPHLLQYQRLFLGILQTFLSTPPDFQQSEQINMLKRIWDNAQLPPQNNDFQAGHSRVSWARLGLIQGDDMFADAGLLGLWCLVRTDPSWKSADLQT